MKSFYEEILSRVGLEDALPKITLLCGRSVFVEGHKGVLSVTDEEILFRVGRQTMRARGKDMRVAEISPEELLVKGDVAAVEVVS